MIVERFAARLKKLRMARGLTQAALAERAGLGRVFIAKLEGATQDPSLTTLVKLAKALRVTVGRLVE